MTGDKKAFEALDAQTFASTIGQAAWLMTMSKAHRDLPIKSLEDHLAPSILFKQFKLYSKGKQPVAFLIWASVSDEIKARIEAGDKTMDVKDWRSGEHIVVLDVISPFAGPAEIEKQFRDDVAKAMANAS